MAVSLDPRLVHMPEFGPGKWLNHERPLSQAALRGQVVLVDFWDYSCVNCLRTLPYLKAWHQRYADKGLMIIGVHAPEFQFAKLSGLIETAVSEFGLPYPILLDNEYDTWSQFTTKAWPTKFLIDQDGYIRLRRQGEGHYQTFEEGIQQLLLAQQPKLSLPPLLAPLRPEDRPGAICYRPTPELYAGYQGGGLFGGALGNQEGYMPQSPALYNLPPWLEREPHHFYVEGIWQAWPEALAYAGQSGGKIVLPYAAVGVNAVLSPSADPVETALNLRPSAARPLIDVQQNGRYLTPENAGQAIQFDDEGRSFVQVERPQMYHLVENGRYDHYELQLTFRAPSLALYAFTFNTCISPPHMDQSNTFTMP